MHATLKLAADLELRIQPQPLQKLVNIEIVEGVWYGDGEDPRTVKQLALTKAEARAFGSTIMGCAADL